MCRRQLLVLVVASLLHFFVHVGGDDTSCDVDVIVGKKTRYEVAAGRSQTLHCPVKYCGSSMPKATWCKFNGSECIPVQHLQSRISTEWTTGTQTFVAGDFILSIKLVELNDTGMYRCKAEALSGQNSVSNKIHLIVIAGGGTELANNTEAPARSPKANVISLVYVCASVGAFCLIIITSSFLVYISFRRRKEKYMKSNEPGQERSKGVAGADSPGPSDIFASTQSAHSSPNYSSMIGLPQDPHEETVYDNDGLPSWKPIPTGPPPSNTTPACDLSSSFTDNNGVLVYAALNHSGNEPGLVRERSGVVTEYAAICVKD
ncbi:B- and T-lymphocyte attenuator [Lissotriton helveticus]